MLKLILHYVIFCSSVLICAVGLSEQVTEISANGATDGVKNAHIMLRMLKCAIVVFCTVCLSYVIVRYILDKAQLLPLMPLVSLLVFIVCSVFVEALIRITTQISTAEFSIGYLTVLLTMFESRNIADAMIISFSCVISYTALLPLVGAMKMRCVSHNGNTTGDMNERVLCSVLVGLQAVILSFQAF